VAGDVERSAIAAAYTVRPIRNRNDFKAAASLLTYFIGIASA
jgi:hypothetical protein